MEVYRTLDAIITTLEESEKIGRARLSCGTLAIIDFYKLKYNKRLEGAQVFKMLFNLEDNTSFAKMPMDVDENGYITLLHELSINSREWSLFKTFLHFGDVPGYKQYLKYRDRPNYNLTNSNLEDLKIVCDKFGCIPTFDVLYENFHAISNDYGQQYQHPDEDIKGHWQWKKVVAGGLIDSSKGWSYVSSRTGKNHSLYDYYRRSWDWCNNSEFSNNNNTDESESLLLNNEQTEMMMNITMQ
jgi:hypothetical protein